MKRYQIEINTWGRILNDMDPDHFGTYGSAWKDTLEDAEEFIFRRTRNLDEKIMAYKASIKENGQEIAFWTNDIKQAK